MKYVNIDSQVFEEPGFTDATLKQVGIWLKLYLYCVKAENGGIITTAGNWSDTHCKRVLGCSRKDLDRSPLWHIKPGGLLDLYHYNRVAEAFSKARRKSHRLAVSSRSEAKGEAARENGLKGGRPRKIITLPAQ